MSAAPDLMMRDLIVFDMDGVLVEVTASYRAAIQATVLEFTGYEPSNEEIQDWKNRGGWNDDWQLSHRMIQERGVTASYQDVVDCFQRLFLGENVGADGENDGLILREEWIARDGLFARLRANHRMAVFTGRLRDEAFLTINRFLPDHFDMVVGSDNVSKAKPDPEGLLKIRDAVPHGRCWYVGDSVDDARASKSAGVPFIGIAAPGNPRYAELVQLLRDEGAIAVIDDINSLEEAIAANR